MQTIKIGFRTERRITRSALQFVRLNPLGCQEHVYLYRSMHSYREIHFNV